MLQDIKASMRERDKGCKALQHRQGKGQIGQLHQQLQGPNAKSTGNNHSDLPGQGWDESELWDVNIKSLV